MALVTKICCYLEFSGYLKHTDFEIVTKQLVKSIWNVW